MNKSIIESSFDLRELSRGELVTQLKITDQHIEEELQYEKIKKVSCLHHSQAHPGHFYFKGDALKMIYISDEGALSDLSFEGLQAKYGEATEELRCRAGKHIEQYVYPEKGLAYAADEETIYFIEIFPKTTLADYLAEIYEEPPVFRK